MPPVLLIHGAWHAAWCWDRGFLDLLAGEGLEVHALSLRGHGASWGRDKLRTTRIRDFADDVIAAADGLRATPVLIGHSMGGFVVQKLMERRTWPGAVLMASAPPNGIAGFVRRLVRADPVGVLQANLTFALKSVVSTKERVRRLFFSNAASDREVEEYAALMGNEAFLAYLDMMFLDLCGKPKSGTPVLVLGAEDDVIFSPDTTRRIADTYDCCPVMFPNMAHDMMLEPGWQDVARTIVRWVEREVRSRDVSAA